jgi:hypothetical protein
MSSTIDVARSPLPEHVEKYEGRWIAIRNGEVIADAATLDALRKNRRVRPTDVLYRVPERDSYFY